jgi:DNA-binding transcriptional LysR family regulator
MIDIAATHHFPEELQAFRAQHPDLSFHLRVGPSRPLFEMLVKGDLDLAVCVETAVPFPGIVTQSLLEEELAVYRQGGGKLGPSKNWGPWVLFPEESHTREIISNALIARGAPVEVIADSPQPEVLREMVNLGLGWTVLPTRQAESGERPLIPSETLGRRTLVLAFRSNAATVPAVVALSESLHQSVSD